MLKNAKITVQIENIVETVISDNVQTTKYW